MSAAAVDSSGEMAAVAALAPDIEGVERLDDPVFELMDIASQILAASPEVEHHIGDALAGAVIGVLAAAPGGVDGKTVGVDEVLGPGAGA